MLTQGDTDINQLTHVAGFGFILIVTGVLALLGLCCIVRHKRRDRWWLYIVYGLIVAPIPASLTKEYLHTLRLAPLAVFVLVLGIAGSLASGRLLSDLLYEVKPGDPVVIAAIAGLLAIVAVLSSWLPARRAATVDPLPALREE